MTNKEKSFWTGFIKASDGMDIGDYPGNYSGKRRTMEDITKEQNPNVNPHNLPLPSGAFQGLDLPANVRNSIEQEYNTRRSPEKDSFVPGVRDVLEKYDVSDPGQRKSMNTEISEILAPKLDQEVGQNYNNLMGIQGTPESLQVGELLNKPLAKTTDGMQGQNEAIQDTISSGLSHAPQPAPPFDVNNELASGGFNYQEPPTMQAATQSQPIPPAPQPRMAPPTPQSVSNQAAAQAPMFGGRVNTPRITNTSMPNVPFNTHVPTIGAPAARPQAGTATPGLKRIVGGKGIQPTQGINAQRPRQMV